MAAINYDHTREHILNALPPEDRAGIDRVAKQVVRNFVHLGQPITKETFNKEPTKDEVIKSLAGKNLTVMCGGGKDSEFVLSVARAIQLLILNEYGTTFELRVGIGRQPGMIDVYHNLENCFEALALKGDRLADLFYIDGKKTSPYNEGHKIPENVIRLNRENVLMNGHIFGGAGRRTFCDDCNKMLSGWIATGLAYKGGADLYMTGDSRQELRAQIKTAVPKIAGELGAVLPTAESSHTSPTQYAFTILQAVGDEHSRQVHGEMGVEERSVPAEGVPERTRLISTSPAIKYESADRLPFLTDFLKFGFDTLMFSFTESDCGNPALMCHLYGLIAEHAYGNRGASYADGVRMYVDHATEVMGDKGFPTELVAIMKDRYKDDTAIADMRKKVEEYADRAYGLSSENLIAMVYSPFTQGGLNLHRYLVHLADSGYPKGNALLQSESKIRALLDGGLALGRDNQLLADIQDATGLTLQQMHQLSSKGLAINNFDQNHVGYGNTDHLLRTMRDSDTLYTHLRELRHDGKVVALVNVQGR